MERTIRQQMAQHHVQGLSLAVIDQGRLGYVKAFGLLEAGTSRLTEPRHLFHACSISKLVTAMTALVIVQHGALDLDTDVNRYLCDWRLPGETVTLRHLLSHQAGIVDPDGSFTALRPGEPHPTLLQLLRGESRILAEGVHVSLLPGSQFAYSDAGYCVVEQLLTDVTGQPFADVVRQYVLGPLGMEQTLVTSMIDPAQDAAVAVGHDLSGRVIQARRPVYPFLGPAGIWSCPGELAQLELEVMAALQGRGRVLNQRTAEMLTSPPWHPLIGLGIFLDRPAPSAPWYYHYGWGEGFQGALSFSPSLQGGVVILMNADPGVPQWQSLIGEVGRLVAAEMGWPRSPIPALC